MNVMKVSVIVPVYNVEKYLRQCLDSIVNQTLKEIEIICVDDGSMDGSAAILSEYAARDGRIRVLTQANSGQGAARNRALELAKGDYVYFMDADDELNEPDIFTRLADELGREELDVLFFDAETKIDEGVAVSPDIVRPKDYIRFGDYSGVYTGVELLSRLLKNNEYCVSPCLMMLKRSFVEENRLRFPEARYFYEDNIFMTKVMMAAKRASHRPWRGYLRKVHAGSTVTSSPGERHINGYRACLEDVRALLKRDDWDGRTRLLLREREMVYLHQLHRLEGTRRGMKERIIGYVICLRCRSIGYVIRRIVRKVCGK